LTIREEGRQAADPERQFGREGNTARLLVMEPRFGPAKSFRVFFIALETPAVILKDL